VNKAKMEKIDNKHKGSKIAKITLTIAKKKMGSEKA